MSSHHTPIYTRPLRAYQETIEPPGHPSEVQSEYDAPTYADEAKGPCPPGGTGWNSLQDPLQGLHKDLCRTVWAHPCNETERTLESGPQRRRERLGYCRACLERATSHGLVSSGGGGLGTVPVPQIAVGVVAHSQRAEPHE